MGRSYVGKREKRYEKDRLRRERELLARVLAEPILTELLPRSPFREMDDHHNLWYFEQVQEFLAGSNGDVGIKFKIRPLIDLLRDGSTESATAEVNAFVTLQRRRGRKDRGGNWYFFAKVLFRGNIDHPLWSEQVSDRIKDHGWMRRTGRRLCAWDIRQVHEGFQNLFGVLLF